jgi:hypothetical protein
MRRQAARWAWTLRQIAMRVRRDLIIGLAVLAQSRARRP